jgi:putative polyhydroxyalkanoate system protein
MTEIHIRRDHQLGLEPAHALAQAWADKAAQKFAISHHWETPQTLQFERPGVRGQVVVGADNFELTAQLGFLFQAFASTITERIELHLDEALHPQRG